MFDQILAYCCLMWAFDLVSVTFNNYDVVHMNPHPTDSCLEIRNEIVLDTNLLHVIL